MKNISFIPGDELTSSILEPPKPSSKYVPEWYKKLSPYIEKNKKFHKRFDLSNNLTAKTCIPFLDSLTSGYMITFPCDVHFVNPEENEYGYRVLWDVSWNVISTHGENQVQGITIPENFDKNAWKLMGNWRIRTPKGYSLLYTHPFYRYDLPFLSATGIVDSDKYDTQINIPFFLKKNFIGTIQAGTPIAQIIPVKRESWKSELLPYEQKHKFFIDNIKLKSTGSYKKRFWQKKVYE